MKNPAARLGPQWIAKTATLVVVVAGAVTVAVSNLPQPVDHTLGHLPTKDEASWAMPLDRYLPVDTHEQDYATDLLIGKCLATEGFDWGVPWQGTDAFPGGDAGDPVDQPLGVSAPADRGYHGPVDDTLSDYLWKTFVSQPQLTAAHQALWDSCFSQLRKTQPAIFSQSGAAQEASTRAVALTNQAYEAAGREPAVISAAARWRSCLTPAYRKALVPIGQKATGATLRATPPTSPVGMPSAQVQQLFSTGVATSQVTAAETELAKQDLACQASSGYRSALYAAEYRLQSTVTEADAKVFARATVDQRAYGRTLDAVIAANLPAKPKQP